MVAFRKNKKYAKKTSGSKKRVYKRNTKSTFNKKVKSVISSMAENKLFDFRGTANLYGANNDNYAASIIPMTPYTGFLEIDQGVGQSDRIGNSIRIKKLQLNGVIRAAGYDSVYNPTPRPCMVKLYFLTRRTAPTTLYTSPLTDVLQYSSSSEGFGIELQKLMSPINTDDWMVHTTRTFKVGFSSFDGSGNNPMSQSYNNNDFKICNFVKIDLTKYCNKIFKFDDNTTLPSTRNIVMYPVVYGIGTQVPSTVEVLANFAFNLHIEFEDM